MFASQHLELSIFIYFFSTNVSCDVTENVITLSPPDTQLDH